MSISDKRSSASRINGAKSRGPVTARGKLNSQRANLRHALLSRNLVFDCESIERFDQVVMALRREFQPETDLEFSLIEKMAACQWREMRIWALEKSVVGNEMRRQLGVTPELVAEDELTQVATAYRTLVDNTRFLELFSRYEARFDREFNRALRRLLEVQEVRRRQPPPVQPIRAA